MRRFLFSRRPLLLAALGAFAARLFKTKPARADLFGGDVAVLGSILGELFSQAAQFTTMIGQLTAEMQSLDAMLSQLSGASFDALQQFMEGANLSLTDLTDNVQSIGYTLQSVNRQFGSVYGLDYRKIGPSEFDAIYGRWNAEVLAASQVAARSQATLSSLQTSAAQAQSILAASRAAGGQVAQMQAIVQMLGLLHTQNASLVQSLTTTGRVLTSDAAGRAADQQLAREKKRRQLAGYTSRGPSVPPMNMP